MSTLPTVSFSQTELNSLTVKKLQSILKARGMKTSGNKNDLIQRLVGDDKSGDMVRLDSSTDQEASSSNIERKRQILEELKLDIEIQKLQQMIETKTYADETNQNITALINSMHINNLPRPEPPVFNGEALKYREWESAFNTLIDERPIPEEEKIFYLRKYVTGKAREAIEGYLMLNSSEAYKRARETLKIRYGNQFAVTEAFRTKLASWPNISARDAEGLRKYSDFLNQCSVGKSSAAGLDILDDSLEIQKYSRRLPDWALSKWSSRAVEIKDTCGRYPNFEEFAQFVNQQADLANDPVFSINALKGPARSINSSTVYTTNKLEVNDKENAELPQNYSTIAGSLAQTNKFFLCPKCKSNKHHLAECRQFSDLKYDDRRDLVMKLGLCFSCLKPGHHSRVCQQRGTCSVCGRMHPTCLHKDQVPLITIFSGRASLSPRTYWCNIN